MFKNKMLAISANALLVFGLFAQNAYARGGGGGSGGGGGGGGGFGGASGGSGGGSPIAFIIYMVIIASAFIYGNYRRKKKIEAAKKLIEAAELSDSAWDENKLEGRVKEVFEKFEQDWSNFNVESMKEYLTPEYLRRMTLEMDVLQSEGRRNIMENVNLHRIDILEVDDEVDNSKDRFTAEISAGARDILQDVINNKQLYVDSSSFGEYWTFLRDGDSWKLDLIKQKTEDKAKEEPAIADFASRNGFYYDSDFGWLMMPNKGAIFGKSNFKTSDINNHVIGFFREKIVEFYTFIPNSNQSNNFLQTNYIVAQAVIPKSYNDILVRRKNTVFNVGPWGLRRVQTESNDFEGKFCIWADASDQVSSLELLTPNFMEKIYALPFELNIEVVGNFLYLYAKSRSSINYDKMLEILSWAFDEMER